MRVLMFGWEFPPYISTDVVALRYGVAGSGDRMREMVGRVASHGLESRFLHGVPPSGRPRPPLRARRPLRDAVGFRALRVDGSRGAPAGNAGDRLALGRRSEVIRNVMRVEFGDVEDLASKILAVLLYPPLRDALSSGGRAEVRRLSWRDAAGQCLGVYRELVAESVAAP